MNSVLSGGGCKIRTGVAGFSISTTQHTTVPLLCNPTRGVSFTNVLLAALKRLRIKLAITRCIIMELCTAEYIIFAQNATRMFFITELYTTDVGILNLNKLSTQFPFFYF